MRKSERFQRIVDEINKITEDKIAYIENETHNYQAKEQERYELKVKHDIDKYMVNELREIKSETTLIQAELERKTKTEISEYRIKLENMIFDKIINKLETFARSNNYSQWLVEKLTKEGNDFINGELYIAEKDEKIVKDVIKKYQLTVHIDPIKYGGFRLISSDQAIESDCTFLSMLEDQKDWFYQNMNFEIKEEVGTNE
ncbi:MAG: hypothetical protein WBO70_05935 [Erysipelotrichaceae bacterium]